MAWIRTKKTTRKIVLLFAVILALNLIIFYSSPPKHHIRTHLTDQVVWAPHAAYTLIQGVSWAGGSDTALAQAPSHSADKRLLADSGAPTAQIVPQDTPSHWIVLCGILAATNLVLLGLLLFRQTRQRRIDPTSSMQHQPQMSSRQRFTAMLQQNDAHCKALFQHLPNTVVLVFDRELRYLFAEGESLKLFGLDRATVEGQTLYETTPAAYIPMLERQYQSALAGETVEYEMAVQERIFQHHIVPLRDTDDQIRSAMMVVHDVTLERLRSQDLHYHQALLKAILDNSSVGIYVKDLTGRYLVVNNYILQVHQLTQEHMIGTRDRDLFSNTTTDSWRDHERAVREQKQTITRELLNPHTNGVEHIYLETKFPLLDEQGDVYAIGGIATDINERKVVEQELLNSRALLCTSQRSAKIGGWELEVATGTLNWTDEMYRIYDIAPDIPLSLEMAITPYSAEARSALLTAHRWLCETGEPYELELPFVTFTGNQIWVQACGDATWQDDVIIKVSGTLQDITRRKLAESDLQRYQALLQGILDNAPVAIFAKDLTGRVILANAYLENFLNQPPDALLGTTGFDFFALTDEPDAPAYLSDQQIIQNQQTYTAEVYGVDRDNQKRYFLATRFPLYDVDWSVTGICTIATDISERRRTEAALRRAKDEAEAANHAKGMFLAHMNHELRTPLNAILGYAQLIGRESDFPPHYREYLQIIETSGMHLLSLINSVLEMSKIEAGHSEVHIQTVDLHALLADLNKMFQLRAQAKGLQFRIECTPHTPPYIATDKSKLRQILINLIDNALKFTAIGNVTLHIDYQAADREGRLQVEITDTGPGIATDELPLVFEAFMQTSSGRKTGSGTGLGLAISREFVRMLGGDIDVHSETGVGTRFSFSIVARRADGEMVRTLVPEQVAIGLTPGQPLYRILIVEDHQESSHLLTELLVELGFAVQSATDGRTAVMLVTEWQPHLVFMDMQLPILDGYAATRQIKALLVDPQPVVVAMTANTFDGQWAEMQAAGCDDFIGKPLQLSAVCATLVHYLDVAFIYADQPSISATANIAELVDQLHHLGPQLASDWLERLRITLDLGDVERMLAVIYELHALDSSAAEQLTDLINNYQFDRIIEVVQQVEFAQ